MFGGVFLYFVGFIISFDLIDGFKKYDLYQIEEDDRKYGFFVNINGVYVFDVVLFLYYILFLYFGEKLNDFILVF